MNANATCRTCHQPIVWLLNPATDKKVPVDARTVNRGDRHYAKTSGHVSHFITCPHAQAHSKRGMTQATQLESTAAGPLEVYDDYDLDETPARPASPYTARPHKERPAFFIPKDASPEVESLYRRTWELELDRDEMRIILGCAPYRITGNPMTWDAATLARAREAIERTAQLRDETLALFEAARRHPDFPRR